MRPTPTTPTDPDAPAPEAAVDSEPVPDVVADSKGPLQPVTEVTTEPTAGASPEAVLDGIGDRDAPAAEAESEAPVTEAETEAAAAEGEAPVAQDDSEAPSAEAEGEALVAEAERVPTPMPGGRAGQPGARRPERPTGAARPGAPGGAGRPGSGRGGRPGRPGVMPSGPGARGHSAPTVEPVVEPIDPHKWGRIDDDGVVYVYSAAGERAVGSWQAGDNEAGLAHYGRRYDDFVTEIALLETRLATGSGDPKAARAHAVELRDSAENLSAVGDLDSAAARLEVVIGAADIAIAGASQARVAARARAVAAKEALCVEAEAFAESTQWKTTGDRLKEIVDEWRTIHGIDRKTDDALWKRFAKARDAFTKRRGTHFADLDKQRGAAREAKEKLIARAEELAKSSEWGKTAGEYRTLMEEWKASGRAPREVEDQLWDRFRAAQESFFSRRNSTFSQRDEEFDANAAAKEKLLVEAERIDPAKGLDAARAALRSLQERWEAAGKVPRERIREFDTRLRAVEDKVKKAEDSHWRRTDPETAARIDQFRSRAEQYRAQAAKARASGDERRAVQAEAQATQWEEWLATAEGSTR